MKRVRHKYRDIHLRDKSEQTEGQTDHRQTNRQIQRDRQAADRHRETD